MSRLPKRNAGASSVVQRALGWTGGDAERATRPAQLATCPMCGSELRFSIGDYGQTLEICTSRSGCPGRVPHRPMPDPGTPAPKVRAPRVKRGRTSK